MRKRLEDAVRAGDEQAVASIVEGDASLLEASLSLEHTPLSLACLCDQEAVARRLLSLGASVCSPCVKPPLMVLTWAEKEAPSFLPLLVQYLRPEHMPMLAHLDLGIPSVPFEDLLDLELDTL